MKNFITILILSLAIIGCQTPNADPNGRTLIDPTDLIAVADSFNDALNSGDVEAASAMLADDVSWGFPNGVNIEGQKGVWDVPTGILCMVIGSITIYSFLFSIGYFLYKDFKIAFILLSISIISLYFLNKSWKKLKMV